MKTEASEQKPKGLVVFDVEGVLLPKRRYIPFEATRKLGFLKFLKIIFYGLLYEIGLSSLEISLKRIYKCLKGCTVEELRSYFEKVPLLPDSEKVLSFLHTHGWRTALVSSGLPKVFIQELAAKLRADYAFGLELKVVDGKFTGEVEGTVMKKNGKAVILKKILRDENIPSQNCVLVADDRNNLQMFEHAGLRIGYNPDFMLSAKSDYVVTGRLSKILPIITDNKTERNKRTLSKSEILRETIHVSGFAVPFICTYVLNPYLAVFLIFVVTLLYGMSELARIMEITFPIFTSITSHAAVRLEPYEFVTAPIFYAFGIMLSIIIFPPQIGYASIAVLTLGDGFASLFGKLGRKQFSFNKTKHLEGSLFGFIFAFLGAVCFVNPISALIGATVGMLVECLPSPISDNLTVPLISGAAMMLSLI